MKICMFAKPWKLWVNTVPLGFDRPERWIVLEDVRSQSRAAHGESRVAVLSTLLRAHLQFHVVYVECC